MMVKVNMFDFKDASLVLKEKGLISELYEILFIIGRIDHGEIQRLFSNKGWELKNGFCRKQLGHGMRIRIKWLCQ